MLNNSEPLISLITVVYNGSKTLEQTIQSVFNQTFKDIEIIIIDDASTDNTKEVISEMNDQRIIYHQNEINQERCKKANEKIKRQREINKILLEK